MCRPAAPVISSQGDNREKPIRKTNRIIDYDYGLKGCYFITVCTHNRHRHFVMEKDGVGTAPNSVNPTGIPNQILRKWIRETQNKFHGIRIDKYVIMPDHLHLIVNIQEQRAGCSVPDIMRYFKTMTTNEYIRCVKTGLLPPFEQKLWQRSYYDHVIRNQQDYNDAWEYIENNPEKWMQMHEKP